MGASKTITFDDGVNTITIDAPMGGYKTTLTLPFEIQSNDDGTYGIYDPGATYDVYECRCTFELDSTVMGELQDFLNDSTKARASNSVTMTLQSGSGFFPFGPHKGDEGNFTVALINPKFKGVRKLPLNYFHTELTIVNQGSFPAYSLPTDVKDGLWTFGSVTECRFPPGWFKPETLYQVNASLGFDGGADFIDRGTNGDRFNSKFTMVSNEQKASRILDYIVDTARSSTFNITSQNNYYVFGYDKGSSGTYTVKIIDNKIDIVHEKHNRFIFDLFLNWTATV